jgi:predicted histone-like DNA-binding protein
MPVEFTVAAKANPQDRQAPKKYYAIARSSGEISVRELAQMIAKRSTLSTVDVMATLEALLEVIPERIAEGNIVRLGDFGSFSLSVSSDGAEKEEEVKSSLIKGNSLNFRPGKVVQKALDTIEYRKISV